MIMLFGELAIDPLHIDYALFGFNDANRYKLSLKLKTDDSTLNIEDEETARSLYAYLKANSPDKA